MASTATATPRVASDVVRRLGLRDALRVSTGFDRPNISFAVARPGGHEKRALLAEALRGEDALPAIVYAGTRAGAEEIAADLTAALGEEAVAYHAGLDRDHRAEVQRRFLADDVRVICATNAFGMGVDKPNVRTVVHASVPASLEAYYQEAGRAGRDGAPARALLLAENRDKALHVHFIKREEVDPGLPGWLADRLIAAADGDDRYSLDAAELMRDLRGDGERLRALIGHLTRAGVIAPSPSAPDRVAGRITGRFDGRAAALCRTSIEEGARSRWRQYREIWAYVEEEACRRRAILRHFGDASEPELVLECCDVCTPALALSAPPPDPVELGNLDDAILSIATRSAARGGAHHLRRDPARLAQQEDPAQLVRRAAGLRRLVAHAPRRHTRAGGRADRGGAHRDDRRPVSGPPRRRVSLRIAVLISGEGSNLQALIDGLGDACGRDRRSRLRAAPTRAGSSAPRRPGWRRPSSRWRTSPIARSATGRWPTGSSSATWSWWSWRGSWSC